MNLYGIPGAEVDLYWSRIAPLLEKPIERLQLQRFIKLEEIREYVRSSDMQCWVVPHDDRILVAVITQIVVLREIKILTIPYLGAQRHTMHLWLHLFSVLKDFAKAHDCKIVRGWGRPGWEKVLKPDTVRIEFDIEV